MPVSFTLWFAFIAVVLIMLMVDLMVFHRTPHAVKMLEAAIWSVVWIVLALAFNAGVYFELGKEAGFKFLTGYIIEKSLSMDNLFVFLLIFRYFKVPLEYQHKVLFWGILGALIFRALFIATGVSLIQYVDWTIYVLGAFLVISGVKLAFEQDREIHPEKNLGIRFFRAFFQVKPDYSGDRFFIMEEGRRFATPLFVTLIVLETTDIVFATDSIPAILGITVDPFLVYSSNIFAILGLRALYFVLAGMMQIFRFLHLGLSAILVFVGAKMLLGKIIEIPVELELAIVMGILAVSVAVSLLFPKNKRMGSAWPDS